MPMFSASPTSKSGLYVGDQWSLTIFITNADSQCEIRCASSVGNTGELKILEKSYGGKQGNSFTHNVYGILA